MIGCLQDAMTLSGRTSSLTLTHGSPSLCNAVNPCEVRARSREKCRLKMQYFIVTDYSPVTGMHLQVARGMRSRHCSRQQSLQASRSQHARMAKWTITRLNNMLLLDPSIHLVFFHSFFGSCHAPGRSVRRLLPGTPW